MAEVAIDGRTLTPSGLEALANGVASPSLAPDVRERLGAVASAYDRHGPVDVLRSKWSWLVGGAPPADAEAAVRLFVLGHCSGIGPLLPDVEVRALLAARANALATGFSGVRPEIVERLLLLLRDDVLPEVPSLGAVGAAGSIQLAHVAKTALGLDGRVPPFVPSEKEALALINGSSYTTALAGLAVARAARVLRAAEVACALSMEVIRADLRSLSAAAALARGHEGIIEATARLRELVAGSELVTTQRSPDSFSVRCAPAVLGTARQALRSIEDLVTRELNAPSDNPLVWWDEASGELSVVEAGLFHAAPVALAMDHLKAAVTQVASISERRIFRLTYGRLSGLPSFLVPGSGVNSGLMLAQYTAASVLAEAKAMGMPASIDSIPTVQHQEDHVSMGPIAARSALEVVDRVADVVAIELLCAAQGLDYRMAGLAVDASGALSPVAAQQPGPRTRAAYGRIRARVSRWEDDRVLHPDLAALGKAVRDGVFDGI